MTKQNAGKERTVRTVVAVPLPDPEAKGGTKRKRGGRRRRTERRRETNGESRVRFFLFFDGTFAESDVRKELEEQLKEIADSSGVDREAFATPRDLACALLGPVRAISKAVLHIRDKESRGSRGLLCALELLAADVEKVVDDGCSFD